MTTYDHNRLGAGDPEHEVPADLARIAAALDELGQAARESAPPALGDRLFVATRLTITPPSTGSTIADTVAAVGDLGAAERAAARPSLEDRVFMATRATIGRAGKRAAQTVAAEMDSTEPAPSAIVIRQRRLVAFSWPARVAAGLLLAAGVGIAGWLGTRTGSATIDKPTGEVAVVDGLKEAIDQDIAHFSEVLNVAYVRTPGEDATPSLDPIDEDALKKIFNADDGSSL